MHGLYPKSTSMSRQFLNVVLSSWASLSSLHRINLSKSLFYVSPQAAQAAAASSPRTAASAIRSTLTLPPPTLAYHSRERDRRIRFCAFLRGGDGDGGSIVAACEDGNDAIYDIAARSIDVVRKAKRDVSRDAIVTLPVAHDGDEQERLYVIDYEEEDMGYHYEKAPRLPSFDVLTTDGNGHRRWETLPTPPFLLRDFDDDPRIHVDSYAAAGGGRAIYVSTKSRGAAGTYRFDTGRRAWSKAGDWTLPFAGRALHVPELDGLCFGISEHDDHTLCAADLSGDDTALDHLRPPTLQHVWPAIDTTGSGDGDWGSPRSQLVYLGSGRFCIAKSFTKISGRDYFCDMEHLHVLAGVEVLRCDDDGQQAQAGRGLRMVTHKSKRITHDAKSDISWFL